MFKKIKLLLRDRYQVSAMVLISYIPLLLNKKSFIIALLNIKKGGI